MKSREILRRSLGLRPKMNAPGLCRGNALHLPLADIFTLCLRDIAEKLENDVGNERSGQVPALPGVQQGHVQHHNGGFTLFGDKRPLVQNFCVIAPKAVDAFHHQYILCPQDPHQLPVTGPVEVPSGQFLHYNVFLRNAKVPHGGQLARLVLLLRGDTDVSIDLFFHVHLSLLK